MTIIAYPIRFSMFYRWSASRNIQFTLTMLVVLMHLDNIRLVVDYCLILVNWFLLVGYQTLDIPWLINCLLKGIWWRLSRILQAVRINCRILYLWLTGLGCLLHLDKRIGWWVIHQSYCWLLRDHVLNVVWLLNWTDCRPCYLLKLGLYFLLVLSFCRVPINHQTSWWNGLYYLTWIITNFNCLLLLIWLLLTLILDWLLLRR